MPHVATCCYQTTTRSAGPERDKQEGKPPQFLLWTIKAQLTSKHILYLCNQTLTPIHDTIQNEKAGLFVVAFVHSFFPHSRDEPYPELDPCECDCAVPGCVGSTGRHSLGLPQAPCWPQPQKKKPSFSRSWPRS